MRRLVRIAMASIAMLAWTAASALAAPATTLSASSGPPRTAVTVTGSGFDASSVVDVFFDTADIATATSSSTGAVSIAITIPTDAQPGKHWITLDEISTHTGAQASFSVVQTWDQAGWGPSGRHFNPFENTLNSGNVSQLTEAWSVPVTIFGNAKPFVYHNGYIAVFDEDENVHTYSQTGKLEWTAAPGAAFRVSQAAPTSYGNYIYFGDLNGLIAAYVYNCRTDGGACTPAWTKNIGTPVEGGLTVRGGNLYVPGGDGLVHVFNATTGAVATSLTPVYTGAFSAPVTFAADGGAFMVQGNQVSTSGPGGGGGRTFATGTALSAVAVGDNTGFFTSSDGSLYQVPGGWGTSIGGGCAIPPAYANGVVYAASCTTIGAYDAASGTALWTITVPSQPQGLAVANGVLYACVNSQVRMYDASYGGSVGNSIPCSGAPEVLQGMVFATDNELSAATLNGASTTRSGQRHAVRRPRLRDLRPRRRLHRRVRVSR